ncbi:MAG: pseudouridine synthase, partial [Acidobacteriota bacterium]
LARAGVASRRTVEEWIAAGRVTVNGRTAKLGERADLEVDHIRVDGKRIQPRRRAPVYLVLNKPRGVVSTLKDPEGRRSILDLIPERLHKGLVPVGRLDWDSEGLLLLTDDGDFAQAVAHPRYGCVKTYEVKVRNTPKESDLERLRGGIVINGRPSAPADIDPFRGPGGARETSANSWWRVRLTEGRTRQIREMFQRIGTPVQRLRRVAIGSFTAPDVPRGLWRELTPDEVVRIRDTSSEKKPRGAKGTARRSAGAGPRPSGRPSKPRSGRAGADDTPGRGRRGAAGRGGRGRGPGRGRR